MGSPDLTSLLREFLFGFGTLFAIINPYGLSFVFLDRTTPTASLILHDGLLPHLSAARTSRQSVRQSPREADAQGCD